VGAIFAMAQTPDGYLWLGTEFGLFRFDGLHAVLWQPPAGPQLPKAPYALLVRRDGTLWIGTFAGLVSWNGNKLTEYPEVGRAFVTSPLEDREGTVRAGILAGSSESPAGRLCAIRAKSLPNCYATHFITPKQSRWKLKSAMTMTNSDCACATTERAWMRLFSPAMVSRDTIACAWMRERAKLIQGKLVVWSEVDEGTEVELRVPASAAYTAAAGASWFSRKFAGKS